MTCGSADWSLPAGIAAARSLRRRTRPLERSVPRLWLSPGSPGSASRLPRPCMLQGHHHPSSLGRHSCPQRGAGKDAEGCGGPWAVRGGRSAPASASLSSALRPLSARLPESPAVPLSSPTASERRCSSGLCRDTDRPASSSGEDTPADPPGIPCPR